MLHTKIYLKKRVISESECLSTDKIQFVRRMDVSLALIGGIASKLRIMKEYEVQLLMLSFSYIQSPMTDLVSSRLEPTNN
jgi:hypothetical protein